MNRFPISNSTYVQISCVKYIPLLCRIWPGFIQKSSLFYQQSLGMIQTRVPIFLKSQYTLDDKTRTTVQLITYTVPQNCLSIFTIHIQNWSIFVHYSSEAELQIFVLEGHHLSKIQLGANVTIWKWYTYLSFSVVEFVPFFFHGSSWFIKVNDLFTLSCPHLFQIYYYVISPKYKYLIDQLFLQPNNSKPKTGNNVSEFTHSNCITLSYYSSPKHKESAS